MKNNKKYKYLYLYLIILIIFILLLIYINFNKKRKSINNINYMDGIDVIYWINLDSSTERKEHMIKILQNSIFKNIPNIRISGVNGKKEKEKMYQQIEKFKKQDLSNSEYGCLLSHLKAIKKFSESQFNIALILEDDLSLELHKYWKKTVFQVIQSAPKD